MPNYANKHKEYILIRYVLSIHHHSNYASHACANYEQNANHHHQPCAQRSYLNLNIIFVSSKLSSFNVPFYNPVMCVRREGEVFFVSRSGL